MYIIRRIDTYTAALHSAWIVMLLFTSINLLRLATFAFGSEPLFPIFWSHYVFVGDEIVMPLWVATLNVLFSAIFNFAWGGIIGLVGASLYNLMGTRLGGIKIYIE